MDSRYSKVYEDQDNEARDSFETIQPHNVTSSQNGLFKWATLALSFACGAVAMIGMISVKEAFNRRLDVLRPPGNYPFFYEANTTFAAFPSPQSNQAWRDLSPNGLGFIQHPSLGPEILSIAVFHQLHCLNNLRILAYGNGFNGTDPGETPWHIAHCLEYLRNVLLCNADTNLEYTQHSKEENGAMAGFDMKKPHMCRDYSKVFDFAEKWRVYDGKDADERKPIEDSGGRQIHYVDLGGES